MAADGSHPVLRRMARIAAAPTAPEPPVTPGRVLRRAATRAGEALDLALSVATIADERRTLDEVLAGLDEAELMVALDSAGTARGVAVIDLDLRDSLVEVQTLGRLSARPRPEGAVRRAVTAADAALGLPFLDGLLRGVAGAGPGTDLPDWVAGVAGGDRYATRRAVGATLPAGDYRVVTLALDLEGGRAGRLTVVLPPVRSAAAPPPPAHGRDWAEAFRGSVQEASAVLTAVLSRQRITLAEAEALRPGTVLPLPGVTVGSVRLEAPLGEVLATARLGQVAGLRAVRLERRAAVELSDGRPPGGSGLAIVDAEADFRLEADDAVAEERLAFGDGMAEDALGVVDPWAEAGDLVPDAPVAIPPMMNGWAADPPGAAESTPPDETGPPGPFDVAPAEGGGDPDEAILQRGEKAPWPTDPASPHRPGGLPSGAGPYEVADAGAQDGRIGPGRGAPVAALAPDPPVAADPLAGAGGPASPAAGAAVGTGRPEGRVADPPAGAGGPAGLAAPAGTDRPGSDAADPPDAGLDGARPEPATLDPAGAEGPSPLFDAPAPTFEGPVFSRTRSTDQVEGGSGDGGAAEVPGSVGTRGGEPRSDGDHTVTASERRPSPRAVPGAARFALAGEARDFDAEGQEVPDAAIARGFDVCGLRLDDTE